MGGGGTVEVGVPATLSASETTKPEISACASLERQLSNVTASIACAGTAKGVPGIS
jgi:hypothetical protein